MHLLYLWISLAQRLIPSSQGYATLGGYRRAQKWSYVLFTGWKMACQLLPICTTVKLDRLNIKGVV